MRKIKTSFLLIFSFLLGCMVSINFTSIDKSCKTEKLNDEHNKMTNSILRNLDLIILILSAPKNLHRRNLIRETWLKLVDGSLNSESTFKYKHYFVIGSLDLNRDQLKSLRAEQAQSSDLLIISMHDSYKNLTEKIKRSFQWLHKQSKYGLEFKYVLKCDDDSFVNMQKLVVEIPHMKSIIIKSNLRYSLNLSPEKLNPYITTNLQVNTKDFNAENLDLYWGYFSGNAKVKSAGKWKETDWIACDKYVPYALGGGYILSRNLVSYIAINANNLRSFKSEDISVGLWLGPVNNILRIHDIRFDTEWITRGCQNSYLISHNLSSAVMKKMYENIMNTKQLCSWEVVKRSYYLYNWSGPPTQCCKSSKEPPLIPAVQVQ